MKKIPQATVARPSGALARVPRSRMETAAQLVRMEFESARLQRELDLLDRRAQSSGDALGKTRARIAQALARLSEEDAP